VKILFVSPGGKERSVDHNRYDVLCRAICQDHKHTARVALIDLIETTKESGDPYSCEEDVIIIHSSIINSHFKMIQKWKAIGKMVIADLCQPVWFEEMQQPEWSDRTGNSYTRELFSRDKRHGQGQLFRWGIRLVDGVLCNSRKMIEDWNERSNVFYLPDFINLDEYLIHGFDPHPGVVVGIKILENGYERMIETGLFDAIEAVGKERPDAKFLFYGDMINIQRKIDLKPEQKIYIPARDIKDWQKVLSTIDLGLIPLSGMRDDRNGWFDALEYMVMKIPWVGSSSFALSDLGQYGWLVQNNDSIWKRVIMDMVGNTIAYKQEAASEPYLFAIGQGVDEYIEKLYTIINRTQVKPFIGVMAGNVANEYYARR
jgi:hypothetical protein